jgi:hypothetical protein
VGRLGNRSLFQDAGIVGGGEHLPATAAAGATAPSDAAANPRRGSTLLGDRVPMVRRLAKVVADRDTGNGIEVAPPRLAGVLAPAFKAQR